MNRVKNQRLMDPVALSLYIIAFIFSIIAHEVMHGLVALKFGDHTAERTGRLTLNPIPHIDLIGSILVPGFLILSAIKGLNLGFIIGWAKPVPVNPLNFSDLRRGEFFVSAAGIATNFALAIIFALLFHLLKGNFYSSPILTVLPNIAYLNLLLGTFNLLPVPPLDGSKILLSQLPYNLAKQFEQLEQYGYLIIFILLASGLLQSLLGFIVGNLGKILGI